MFIFMFNLHALKGDHTLMLIQTNNPNGFGFELEVTSTTFFLRLPRLCEITHTHDFGWSFTPRHKLVRLEESWRQRHTAIEVELQGQ